MPSKSILAAFLISWSAAASTYVVTGYCPCRACCGVWAATGRTASGEKPKAGVTIGGPSWWPYGTRKWLPGIGWRTVQDRMAKRFRQSRRVDLFFASHAEAKRFGVRRVEIAD